MPAMRCVQRRNGSLEPSNRASPESGNFNANPVMARMMKLAASTKCCQRCASAHAHHRPHGHAITGGDLAQEQHRVVNEHRPDGAEDEHQINPAHPRVDLQADAVTAVGRFGRFNVHVDFAGGEIFVGARMAFAAGLDKVCRVDGRVGVGRGQNFVVAVATAAVGGHGRAVLRREAVIAVKEGLHPVAGQFVFGVEPFRSVAAAANLGGNFRRSVFQAGDLVFGMAVGAGGRVAHARRQSPCHARLPPSPGLLCRGTRRRSRARWE